MPESFAERAKRIAMEIARGGDSIHAKLITAPRDYALKKGIIKEGTDEEKANRTADLTVLRNKAEMFAAPKAMWMEQNVPGFSTVSKPFRDMERYRSTPNEPRDEGELDEPSPRQPIQMEREFSNEEDKNAYIERIRQAQKNAAK